MRYLDITKDISAELNIPEEVIKEAYVSYWKFIKEKINELPLKDFINEEDFNKLRTNFNIPSLGKLNCTYKGYFNKRNKYLKVIEYVKNKEDKADVHCISDNNG